MHPAGCFLTFHISWRNNKVVPTQCLSCLTFIHTKRSHTCTHLCTSTLTEIINPLFFCLIYCKTFVAQLIYVASLPKPFLSHVYSALHCNLSWPVICCLPIKIPLNYRTLCLINLMDAPSVIPQGSREKSCEGKRESDFFGMWVQNNVFFTSYYTLCVNDAGHTTQAHIYHLLLCSSVFNMLGYIFPTPWCWI